MLQIITDRRDVDFVLQEQLEVMGHGAKVSAEGPGLDLRSVFSSTC